MEKKSAIAQALASLHSETVPSIELIQRLLASKLTEQSEQEPVKLLEVNPETSASGIVPIAFGADPPEVLHPSVVVEVTPEEYEKVKRGDLSLPAGWTLGEVLFRANTAAE